MSDLLISVDLGQAGDYTAITIGETIKIEKNGKDALRLEICHAERLPKGMSYVDQVERVAELRLCQNGELERCLRAAPMLVDGTGVGRAVIDLFRDRGLNPTPISITSGSNARRDPETGYWNVPKKSLVAAVQVMLAQGRLQFAKRLDLLDVILDELREFEVRVTASANVTYSARTGAHDDLVLSIAQACYWTLEHGPVNWTGAYKGIRRRNTFERPRGVRGIWKDRSTARGWR